MSESLQQVADQQGNVRYGYGGFWWRALAFLIDFIIVTIATSIGSVLFLIVPILLPLAPLIIDAAYSIFMESSPTQGTVGKMICRLKVADMGGQRISVGKAALRYISKWLSTILLFIGFLLVFFNKRKQALHDMMAGTVVLRVQEDRTFADPIAGYHAQQTQARAYQPSPNPAPPTAQASAPAAIAVPTPPQPQQVAGSTPQQLAPSEDPARPTPGNNPPEDGIAPQDDPVRQDPSSDAGPSRPA